MSYRKFTKDIGVIGLTNLVMALRGLVILPIITKILGAENYGIWAQIIVAIYLLTPLANLGLPYTLVRFLAAEKDKKEIQEGIYSVFSLIFITVLIISLILILFSSPISGFLKCQENLIRILAFIVFFECLNGVFLNIFRAFQQIKKYSFFFIFQGLGEAGLTAGVVLTGFGLFGAVFALLIIRIINFLMMGSVIIKKIGIKMPNFSRIKEYLHFGLPTVPGNISSWFIHYNDRYLIGYFLGALFVGYYVPAYVIGGIISFLQAPLSFLLPAVLSKSYDENKIGEVKTYLKYSLKYFLMIAIPAFFGLSVLAKQLLTIFTTSEIAQQGYLILPFMSLSMLLYGLYGIIPQILILVKKTQILGKIWLGATLLNLGLNFTLIPRFGIMAAAINTLITYLIIFFLTWYYSFKYFQFEIDWKFIKKSVLASILMLLFLLWFNPAGITKTSMAIFLGALLYALLIFLFKGFKKKELNFFKNLVRLKQS